MLNGLRIADMTTVIFGPYCTQMLADLGADVIKVEPEGGDATRNIGKSAHTPFMGAMHLRINRGKRSVDWDLKSKTGRAAMEQLTAHERRVHPQHPPRRHRRARGSTTRPCASCDPTSSTCTAPASTLAARSRACPPTTTSSRPPRGWRRCCLGSTAIRRRASSPWRWPTRCPACTRSTRCSPR